MLALVGAALIFTLILFLLRELGFRGTPVVAVAALVLLMIRAVEQYSGAVGRIWELATESGASGAVASMLKVTGLSYLYGISADVCRELGESGLARAVEVVGRVEIILVAIPYFQDIITLGVDLI